MIDTIKVETLNRRKRAWWLIDPRTNRYIGQWDILTSIALVFTALVTPFEVSFLPPPTTDSLDVLFYVNRAVDVIFLIDMWLQFGLIFQVQDTLHTHTVCKTHTHSHFALHSC